MPEGAVRSVSSHWGSGSHLLLNRSQSESDLAQPGPAGPLLPPHKEDFLLSLCLGEGWANKDSQESFDLAHGLVRQTAQTDSIMSAPRSPSSESSATRLRRLEGAQNQHNEGVDTDWPDSIHSFIFGKDCSIPCGQNPLFSGPFDTAATTITSADRLRLISLAPSRLVWGESMFGK